MPTAEQYRAVIDAELARGKGRAELWPFAVRWFGETLATEVLKDAPAVGVLQPATPLPARRQQLRTVVEAARCIHLGEQVGETECIPCGAKTRLKVFQCSHPAHETTTIPQCQWCNDHQAETTS